MFDDLTSKEKQILDIYAENEKCKNYDLHEQLNMYDPTDEISVSLSEKGYINADVSVGKQGDICFAFNYRINGHILTDYSLSCYNIEK